MNPVDLRGTCANRSSPGRTVIRDYI